MRVLPCVSALGTGAPSVLPVRPSPTLRRSINRVCRSWIPFLANGGGDHLCVDLSAEDGGVPGQLIAFWHDWEKHSVAFPSMKAWLTDLVESMESDC